MRRQSSHAGFAGSLARLPAASAAVTAILAAGLGGCQTMSDVTGSLTSSSSKAQAGCRTIRTAPSKSMASAIAPIPRMPTRHWRYGQALRATGQRAQAAAVLEQATIAHPGNKALLAAYGRALADNGNSQAAFDVLEPRPFARQSRLAHSFGAGHHARQARQARGGAPLLRQRAEDRAGRAVGAVQSRPVLHADAGFAAGRRDAAARLCQSAAPMRGCGRTWRWWSACRAASPKPRPSSRPICRPTKPPPTSPICARC